MIEDENEIFYKIQHNNLKGINPSRFLLYHGPKKLLLNAYHWHSPGNGVIASYAPTERDVEDHFGVFRGVDQIEAFAQATVVSCATFLECRKLNLTPEQLKTILAPVFISIGKVSFYSYLEQGDRFISIGNIKLYKWRQMVCDGRIYKVPQNVDPDEYFKDFTEERLLKYDISEDFICVADLSDITGRGVKKELLKKNE
jgi:hypothetical protein